MSSIDQERVQQLKEHIENGRHPDSFIPDESEQDTEHNTVSVAECLRMREWHEDPEVSVQDIVDSVERAYRTVLRHINGECSHETITKRQCNAIRCAAQDGKTAGEITALFGFLEAHSAARDHATGDCNHDSGVEPAVMRGGVSAADCRQMRSKYENSDMAQHEVADVVGCPPSTAEYHLNRRCLHDHD